MQTIILQSTITLKHLNNDLLTIVSTSLGSMNLFTNDRDIAALLMTNVLLVSLWMKASDNLPECKRNAL